MQGTPSSQTNLKLHATWSPNVVTAQPALIASRSALTPHDPDRLPQCSVQDLAAIHTHCYEYYSTNRSQEATLPAPHSLHPPTARFCKRADRKLTAANTTDTCESSLDSIQLKLCHPGPVYSMQFCLRRHPTEPCGIMARCMQKLPTTESCRK